MEGDHAGRLLTIVVLINTLATVAMPAMKALEWIF